MHDVEVAAEARMLDDDDDDIGHCSVDLCYDQSDPYAVTLAFSNDLRWTFGRDLLKDGLREPIGDGDVSVFPAKAGRTGVCVQLAGTDGTCVLLFELGVVQRFVRDCYTLVPAGGEVLDVDAAIEKLLEKR